MCLKTILRKIKLFFRVITFNVVYTSPHDVLRGKNIIVTGGGRGLGFSMAKRFCAEGANVLIVGRNLATLESASRELGCKYLVLDICHSEVFDDFIRNAEKEMGPINCLVNNAGISLHENDYDKVTPESFDEQITINLKGPFFLAQSFAKYLTGKKREGNILFISSETSELADIRPYGWTKASINSLVKGLAARLRKSSIRVNALAPGVTASDMTGYSEDNLFPNKSILYRVFHPDEVAEIATFLLSDASRLINGQIIVCNEGRTINSRIK